MPSTQIWVCFCVCVSLSTFQDDKRLFMLMEYINGGELFSYLRSVSQSDSSSRESSSHRLLVDGWMDGWMVRLVRSLQQRGPAAQRPRQVLWRRDHPRLPIPAQSVHRHTHTLSHTASQHSFPPLSLPPCVSIPPIHVPCLSVYPV